MRKYERIKCDDSCGYITYKNKWLYCDCYDEKLRMHIGPDGPEDMVYLIAYRCDDCIDDEIDYDEEDIEEGYGDGKDLTLEERIRSLEDILPTILNKYNKMVDIENEKK